MKLTLFSPALLCVLVAATSPARAQSPAPEASPSRGIGRSHVNASSPAPNQFNKQFFLNHHAAFLKRAAEGNIGLLFLGDSITERWNRAPDIWNAHYAKYNPANFGISGDSTQNVLWRIDNGEINGISPKVVVLLIGTNNTASNSANEIAAAVKLIVQEIREKLPQTRILLLAVFPRWTHTNARGMLDNGERHMAVIRPLNAELSQLDDGDHVRFLDIGKQFLDSSGKIPLDVMPDQLHPSAKGYEIWADAMQPLLDKMMTGAEASHAP